MFNDVDETLRAVLTADVPIDPAEVDITFERPVREWSSRLSRPTLDLFLFDIRERLDFRDDSFRQTRALDGRITLERGPRRVDLAYMVTAWAREPADEHRILGRVLACMYRQSKVAEEHLQGYLQDARAPLLLRAMPADYLAKPADIWGVLDNELRTALTWVATAPLDAFAPITGPMVTSRDIGVGPLTGPPSERAVFIAGVAHRKGSEEPVAGVRVRVAGMADEAVTGRDGRFQLPAPAAGKHRWLVEPPGEKAREVAMTVPSATYDIEI